MKIFSEFPSISNFFAKFGNVQSSRKPTVTRGFSAEMGNLMIFTEYILAGSTRIIFHQEFLDR